jgi:hypothetical protein
MSRFRFLGEDPFIVSLQIIGIRWHASWTNANFLSLSPNWKTSSLVRSTAKRHKLVMCHILTSPGTCLDKPKIGQVQDPDNAAIPQETDSTQRSPWLYLNNHPCPIGHAAAAVCTPTFAYMDSTLHRSTTAPCAPQCFSPNALSFDESGNQ